MADITPQLTMVDHDCFVLTWGPFTENDNPLPLTPDLGSQVAKFTERSVEVAGNFGAGGTVAIQGTNKVPSPVDADFNTLRDPFSVPLTFTLKDLRQIEEAAATYRPKVTAGSGLSVTVRLFTVHHR